MVLEKEDQKSFENNQMYNEIALSYDDDFGILSRKIARLFSIKSYSDLTTNSDNSSGSQLDPKVLTFLLELLRFLMIKDLIRIADDFNLVKKQYPDRKLSLFISHNNEIMNGNTNYCYDDPGDIYPFEDDNNNFKIDNSIIIDFVDSDPVCIRINITFFESFDNSENYVRYTLPITTENELDEDHRYVVDGIAKVHNACDPEEVENFVEEYKYVYYNNNMIEIDNNNDLQITSMGETVLSVFDINETYFTNLN